jgi:hypothetical protein
MPASTFARFRFENYTYEQGAGVRPHSQSIPAPARFRQAGEAATRSCDDPMSNMIWQIMALFDEFATEDARRAEVAIAVRPKSVRVS